MYNTNIKSINRYYGLEIRSDGVTASRRNASDDRSVRKSRLIANDVATNGGCQREPNDDGLARNGTNAAGYAAANDVARHAAVTYDDAAADADATWHAVANVNDSYARSASHGLTYDDAI